MENKTYHIDFGGSNKNSTGHGLVRVEYNRYGSQLVFGRCRMGKVLYAEHKRRCKYVQTLPFGQLRRRDNLFPQACRLLCNSAFRADGLRIPSPAHMDKRKYYCIMERRHARLGRYPCRRAIQRHFRNRRIHLVGGFCVRLESACKSSDRRESFVMGSREKQRWIIQHRQGTILFP